jgi:F-type H+-transporting ATPase subunit delta
MPSSAITAEVVDPYAEALMSLAQAKNLTGEIGDNIRSLLSLLTESRELKAFLENPLVKAEDKKTVLQRVVGGQINHYLLNFLLLLIDRGRIVFIEGICQKCLELLRKLNNIVLAEVTSAVRLYEEEQGRLSAKIKQLTGAAAVEIQTKIDPEIIGGVIIKVGSQVYDASLRGQLRRISLSLLSAA